MPERRIISTFPVDRSGERSYDHHKFSPDQLRAARALLNWSQDDLANEASVAVMMIKNFERSLSDPRKSSMNKLKVTLERAGICFIDETDANGAGVCWANPRNNMVSPSSPE
ncbi:MAG: helix-turn-helix domain-containing protein [Hyphomicrobiaceae bacterium]